MSQNERYASEPTGIGRAGKAEHEARLTSQTSNAGKPLSIGRSELPWLNGWQQKKKSRCCQHR